MRLSDRHRRWRCRGRRWRWQSRNVSVPVNSHSTIHSQTQRAKTAQTQRATPRPQIHSTRGGTTAGTIGTHFVCLTRPFNTGGREEGGLRGHGHLTGGWGGGGDREGGGARLVKLVHQRLQQQQLGDVEVHVAAEAHCQQHLIARFLQGLHLPGGGAFFHTLPHIFSALT